MPERKKVSPRTYSVHREYTWTTPKNSKCALNVLLDAEDFNWGRAHKDKTFQQQFGASIDWCRRSELPSAFQKLAKQHGKAVREVVVSFVQSLIYCRSDEPALLPPQVLANGIADCKDRSLLAAGLLRVLGYDTALWLEPGHMALAIVFPDGQYSGWHITAKGRDYYFWELTAKGCRPGERRSNSLDVSLIFPRQSERTNLRHKWSSAVSPAGLLDYLSEAADILFGDD